MATYENIIYEKRDKIATITLNQPEKLNALSVGMRSDLMAALKEVKEDDDVRVVIIKGNGRAFCSGYDMSGDVRQAQQQYLKVEPSLMEDRAIAYQHAEEWLAIWDLPKYVIAQVHGYCIAAGSLLAGICDLTIVAEDAKIGTPQVGPIGAATFVPIYLALMGLKRTKQYNLHGTLIDGKEAERIGFANMAVPADKLEEEVDRVAKEVARTPLEILTLQKAAVNRCMEMMGFRNWLYVGAELAAIGINTESAKEFIKRVVEKGQKQASIEWKEGKL